MSSSLLKMLLGKSETPHLTLKVRLQNTFHINNICHMLNSFNNLSFKAVHTVSVYDVRLIFRSLMCL